VSDKRPFQFLASAVPFHRPHEIVRSDPGDRVILDHSHTHSPEPDTNTKCILLPLDSRRDARNTLIEAGWEDQAQERDKRDRERKVSPLVRANDTVLIDNTAMDAAETARLIVMLAREREKELATAAGRKP